MYCAYDLELETEKSKQEWLEIKKDSLQYTIQNMEINQRRILLNIKRVFGVTPQISEQPICKYGIWRKDNASY